MAERLTLVGPSSRPIRIEPNNGFISEKRFFISPKLGKRITQSILGVLVLWIKRNSPLERLLGRFRMIEAKQGIGEVIPRVEGIGI